MMNRDGFLGVVTPIGGPDPLISFQLVSVTTVGVRGRNRSGILVGRPGLDYNVNDDGFRVTDVPESV
jgi:hypothetical protein